jgi:hypothetical protein
MESRWGFWKNTVVEYLEVLSCQSSEETEEMLDNP